MIRDTVVLIRGASPESADRLIEMEEILHGQEFTTIRRDRSNLNDYLRSDGQSIRSLVFVDTGDPKRIVGLALELKGRSAVFVISSDIREIEECEKSTLVEIIVDSETQEMAEKLGCFWLKDKEEILAAIRS